LSGRTYARPAVVGHSRNRPAQLHRLRDLPRREYTEAPISQESCEADLGQAAGIHKNATGLAAAQFRLVGAVTPHELFRRSAHGACLVPTVPVRQPASLLLHLLLHASTRAPRAERP